MSFSWSGRQDLNLSAFGLNTGLVSIGVDQVMSICD
jgi:hypothetical protein